MKKGCRNGNFNLKDLVYFMVVVDESPYAVIYKVIEKIESSDGISYTIDVIQEQEEPAVLELVAQGKVGANFRTCGDSIFPTREGAVAKARDYFQRIADQLVA